MKTDTFEFMYSPPLPKYLVHLFCRVIFFYLFLYGIITISYAQSIQRHTFSSIGSSKITDESKILIQQSIGQMSVIGHGNNSISRVSQGFLIGLKKAPIQDLEKSLNVLPFPNAFSDKINLKFFPNISGSVEIFIYSLEGRLVYQSNQLPSNNMVQLDLEFLSNAVYSVLINTGGRFLQTRIIKRK